MVTGTVTASTTLADTGIQILGLVISYAAVGQPRISLVLLARLLLKLWTLMGEEIWLDPNQDEATAGAGTLALGCMPALNVTNVWQNGTVSTKQGLGVSGATHSCRLLFFSISG